MKFTKILSIGFIAVLISMPILITGCWNDTLEEPLSRNYETLTGEFKTLGSIKVDKTITHLFETDEGEIYYTYSDRYDLDDPDYLNQRVEAYGVVMAYESLDKELFEVRRITEADEEENTETEVNQIDYKDTELGVSFTYPDNWTLTALRDSLHLEAPALTDDDGNDLSPDYMIIANLGEILTKTSSDPQEDRATEISAYVEANYEGLEGSTSQMSYVGPDKVFGVRYKTDSGDSSYFVPRGNELFEIGFYHPEEKDWNRILNGNTSAEIVSTFRFLPYGDQEQTLSENGSQNDQGEEAIQQSTSTSDSSAVTNTTPQVSVKSYLDFESAPYGFKISYPGPWYYSGGNGGYDFSDQPIEDDTPILIHLGFNVENTVGVASGKITVKVGDRFYTLSGSPEYQDIMQTMANSIVSTE